MLTPWEIAAIGGVVFGILAAFGLALWLPASASSEARLHMGVGATTGAIVALSVFVLTLLDACNTTAVEHKRELEFLINQKGPYLSGIDLHDQDLRGKYFQRKNLVGANLSGADAQSANFNDARLADTDLSRVNARAAQFERAHLERAALEDADLREADLDSANLSHADLAHAILLGRRKGASLVHATLESADLYKVNLENADLTDADLRDATLEHADLARANLEYADLSGADLSDADLRGADLLGTDLSEAQWNKGTKWPASNPHELWSKPQGKCTETACYFHGRNPRQILASQWPDNLPVLQRSMTRLAKQLVDALKHKRPAGWQLRFANEFEIEVDALPPGLNTVGTQVATFVVKAEPRERKASDLANFVRNNKHCAEVASSAAAKYASVRGVLPVVALLVSLGTKGTSRPSQNLEFAPDDFQKTRVMPGANLTSTWSAEDGFVMRYHVGAYRGIDLYYVDHDREIAYWFEATVRADAYSRYRPDLRQLFGALGRFRPEFLQRGHISEQSYETAGGLTRQMLKPCRERSSS